MVHEPVTRAATRWASTLQRPEAHQVRETHHPGADEAGPPITTQPEAPTPPRPPRFESFDGLRAIAALMVVVLHAAVISHAGILGAYTARLNAGIGVFFLISGFLLYRPFVVARLSSASSPNSGSFWIRRILRIVPAYWVVLFISTQVLHNSGTSWTGGWAAVLTHYLFLQIYFPTQFFSGLIVSWTLCVEMSFYLFLPLYAWAVGALARKSARPPVVVEAVGAGVLIALSLTWQLLADTRHLGIAPQYQGLATIWLPAYLELFGFGMLLAITSTWFHHTDSEPLFFSHRLFPWASWTLAAITYFVMCHLGFSPKFTLPPLTTALAELEGLEGAFALFLLLPAIFGPSRQGLVRRFLQCWPMAALGVISYGLYLWHVTWCEEILHWSNFRLFGHRFPLYLVLVVGLTIIAATVSYFIVEKPALRLKRHFDWFQRGRRPAKATS